MFTYPRRAQYAVWSVRDDITLVTHVTFTVAQHAITSRAPLSHLSITAQNTRKHSHLRQTHVNLAPFPKKLRHTIETRLTRDVSLRETSLSQRTRHTVDTQKTERTSYQVVLHDPKFCSQSKTARNSVRHKSSSAVVRRRTRKVVDPTNGGTYVLVVLQNVPRRRPRDCGLLFSISVPLDTACSSQARCFDH